MSNKWKFAFHMVVMLAIGVAIGAMINRALVQRHLRHMVQMRSAGLLGPGDKMLLRSAAPGQQKQIREILDRHRERLDKIQTRFNTEIQDSFLSLKKEIDPILTPEQKSQLERMFPPPPPFPDRRREGMGPRGGFGLREGPPPPFWPNDMWKDELQLSTDQAEKMEAIMRNFGSRFKLRRREEPEPWSPQEIRKEQEKMEKEIEKILTEEQWRKFSELKKMRRPPPF